MACPFCGHFQDGYEPDADDMARADEAAALLIRVMDALDTEVELGGRVPFDPDDMREIVEGLRASRPA